jgi:hypothetical protein
MKKQNLPTELVSKNLTFKRVKEDYFVIEVEGMTIDNVDNNDNIYLPIGSTITLPLSLVVKGDKMVTFYD